MRKTTIAIIMLLLVTVAFGQANQRTTTIGTKYADLPKGSANYKLMKKAYEKVDTIEIDDAGTVIIGGLGNGGGVPCDTFKIRDTIRIHDTIRVRDTVTMPVYLVDITDTVSATIMYKKSEKSDRIYTTKGYALIRGFKTWLQSKMQWVDKPNIIGALDDRKRPIANVIQVL